MCRQYFSNPSEFAADWSWSDIKETGRGARCPGGAVPWNMARAASCEENGSLFSALINPGADQANLFRSERTDAGLVMRRGHVVVRIAKMSNVVYKHTIGTL